jgi:glycosyltransferase involved in cell wall biosynthesis
MSYAPNIEHDRFVFRAAAAITATSEWAARDLAAQYPDCAGKVHVMPYPVRAFGEEAWIAERFARAPRTKPRALFVGGDFPRKGGTDLLAAWADAELGSVAALDLVTDWPLGPADGLPAGVRVWRDVTPYSLEWTALWRAADLFVMPSRHEAFGMVFQEAAAAGLPVVATRVNAIPEIVCDGVTGLLVARGDRRALAAAVRHLVASADERRRMGAEALARIRRVASLDRYAARLHAVMTGVLFDRGLHV